MNIPKILHQTNKDKIKQIFEFNDHVRGIECRYGFLVYNKYCEYIGKSLELYGEYCQHEMELFTHLIKTKDVVWEIGAHTGSQSVALAKHVSDGYYVGFEPQIELFKLLATNLSLNNCENGYAYNLAIGAEAAIVDLPKVDYHLPCNFGAMSFIGKNELSGVKCEVRSIDELDWLPKPNFIKIDVEGMEGSVIEGGRRTINEIQPIMYVENDRVEKSGDLIQSLWNLNYRLYWHITPMYNEFNFFSNPNNIYGKTGSFNMLCVPRHKKLEVNGMMEITDKDAHPLMEKNVNYEYS